MVSKKLLFLLFLASCLAGHLYCSQVGDQLVGSAHELQQVKPDEQGVPAMLLGAAQEAQPVEHVPLYKKAAYAFKRGIDFCKQYPVTTVLMATNIGVFAAQKVVASKVGYKALEHMLGQANAKVEQGQLWRLVTNCFMHADLGHLVSNSLSLLIAAPLEKLVGAKKFLVFYMASGILSSLASLFMCKCYFPEKYNRLGLGASGAIMGLSGVATLKLSHNLLNALAHLEYINKLCIIDNKATLDLKYIAGDIATVFIPLAAVELNLTDVYSIIKEYVGCPSDNIDHTAHIAGFATGVGLGWAFSD